MMDGVILSPGPDTVTWALEKSGNFSTASLYRELLFPGMENNLMMTIWEAKLPLKNRIFLWQVFNDKIQSAEQLVKRNWPGDIECKMCGAVESTDHIVFGCAMPHFFWCFAREVFGWPSVPTGTSDFQDLFLERADRKTKHFYIFLLGSAAWSLWLIRNDFVFNNVIVSSPEACVFRVISFMWRWEILCKGEKQLQVVDAIPQLKLRLSSLQSSI